MSENQGSSQDAPPQFLRPLKIVLLIQFLFNTLLIGLIFLEIIDVKVMPCCCPTWGFLGLFSLFFLVDVFKQGIDLGREIRFTASLVYSMQFSIDLVSSAVLLTAGSPLGLPLTVSDLILAVATLITLSRFNHAHPLPERVPKSPPTPPEPEEIETSGDWDEAKNPKPKP